MDPAGELDTFLLTDPRRALLGELPQRLQHPGPDHQQRCPSDDDEHRQQRAPGLGELAVRGEEGCHADDDEQQAGGVAATRSGPAARPVISRVCRPRPTPPRRLRLVGLPPEDRCTGHRGRGRPEQPGTEAEDLRSSEHDDPEGGEADQLDAGAGGPVRGLIVGLRHDGPERGVEDDAEPAEYDGDDETDAQHQDVDAEMVGQPAATPATMRPSRRR